MCVVLLLTSGTREKERRKRLHDVDIRKNKCPLDPYIQHLRSERVPIPPSLVARLFSPTHVRNVQKYQSWVRGYVRYEPIPPKGKKEGGRGREGDKEAQRGFITEFSWRPIGKKRHNALSDHVTGRRRGQERQRAGTYYVICYVRLIDSVGSCASCYLCSQLIALTDRSEIGPLD